MKGRFLAPLLLLGAASLAQADYVVIIANLSAQPPDATPAAGGMMGGMGAPGGFRPGGAGGPGMGMLGMRGGMQGGGSPGPGMMGGMMMGSMGMGGSPLGAEEVVDDSPYLVVSVLEVGGLSPAKVREFKKGAPLMLQHRWGKAKFVTKTYFYDAIPLELNNGGMLPGLAKRFSDLEGKIKIGTATTDEVVNGLALWALEHGMLDNFAKVMDKLEETDKSHPAVAAYSKVKADLAKPVSSDDVAGEWKAKLLDGYKITQADGYHFAIIHNSASDALAEVKPQLDRLEKTYKSFYYWWALKGTPLPMPEKRQVAILTEKPEDFRRLHKHLTSSPVMADSFFARREGLSVFSHKRADDSYVTLEKVAKPYWDRSFIRKDLLVGKSLVSGIPKGESPDSGDIPRTYAVLLKALEDEWEANTITHEASRQLIYASGLLPRNVNAPEWVQFGAGAFFEKPLQSPWGGAGGPNAYYLPRFKEYNRAKKYGPGTLETLVSVVTDANFRSLPDKTKPHDGESQAAADRRSAELHTRRARAGAWALTYFLMQRERAGLQRFTKELSRMPRDVELDGQVLLAAFAKAFDAQNPDRTVNTAKLKTLADRWINFINEQSLEADAVHKKIRDHYEHMVKANTAPATGTRPGSGTGAGGGGSNIP